MSDWCNNTPEFLEEKIGEGIGKRGLGWTAGCWDQPWGSDASLVSQPLRSSSGAGYLLPLQTYSRKSQLYLMLLSTVFFLASKLKFLIGC